MSADAIYEFFISAFFQFSDWSSEYSFVEWILTACVPLMVVAWAATIGFPLIKRLLHRCRRSLVLASAALLTVGAVRADPPCSHTGQLQALNSICGNVDELETDVEVLLFPELQNTVNELQGLNATFSDKVWKTMGDINDNTSYFLQLIAWGVWVFIGMELFSDFHQRRAYSIMPGERMQT